MDNVIYVSLGTESSAAITEMVIYIHGGEIIMDN